MRFIFLYFILMPFMVPVQAMGQAGDSAQSKNNAVLANKLYNESIELYQEQKYIEAIGMLNKSIRLRPDFSQAYYNRACLNVAMKYYNDALKDIDKAIQLHPQPEFLALKGYTYHKKGDLQRAYEALTLAVNEYAENAMAFYYRGCAQMALNKHTGALADFDQAIALKPDLAHAYNERGCLYFTTGKYEKAKTDLTRAITFDPKLAIAYNNLGKVLEKMDEMEAATEYFTTALRIDRSFAEAYLNRAKINYATGNYEAAISDFQKTLEIDPENAAVYNDMGLARYMHGELQEAVASFSEAIQLDKDYDKAWLNRGIVREMLRDEKGACKDWTKAADLGNTDAMNYINNQCQ